MTASGSDRGAAALGRWRVGRWRDRLWRWGPALVLAAAVLVPLLAFARPGGGQSFGGGGRSGGGGGGGGGGDGAGYLVARLVIWLLIKHPGIGVPVTIAGVVGYVLYEHRKREDALDGWSAGLPAAVAESDREALRGRLEDLDPNFSLPVFLDFAQGLFHRAHHAAAGGGLAGLAPYLSPEAAASLASMHPGARGLDGLVIGSINAALAPSGEGVQRVSVGLSASFSQARDTGAVALYSEERWIFERPEGVPSRAPDRARHFACPSCGGALEGLSGGVCAFCGEQVATGRFDWRVVAIHSLRLSHQGPTLTGYTEERGTQNHTRVSPGLAEGLQGLEASDPSFSATELEAFTKTVYTRLNEGWTQLAPGLYRPFVSDGVFESFQYWIDAYRAAGLRNRMEDAHVGQLQWVKVARDTHYDAVTLRLWASARDYTQRDSDGAVVGGDPKHPRLYSEYWTFVRSVRRAGGAPSDQACPNCGAALNISQTGECEYCHARVTTGEFGWVLARIEQDEAYVG